jgi:Penicillin-insensitive murein endopeptidase
MKRSGTIAAVAAAVMFGLVAPTPGVRVVHAASTKSGGGQPQASAQSSGPCGALPSGEACIRLGSPAEILLLTIGEVASSCTVQFTVTWGDGTDPESHTLPPNSQLMLEHTYAAPGTYTATVDGTLQLPAPSGCDLVPWDKQVINHVIPRLRLVATLNDIDNKPLRHLSTDFHPYFEANTRIHGTVTVTGAVHDKLGILVLDIRRGDTTAFAFLRDSARRKLIGVPFGVDRKVTIDTSQLLFELPSSQAALFNRNVDGPVQLRLTAGAAGDGSMVRLGLGDRPRLVRYKQNNRYGPRDEIKGGDDWVRPTVRPILVSLFVHFPALRYGDMSNMNGGSFSPPHNSHQNGTDVDVKFPGYEDRDAAVARTIVRHLNDPLNGSAIQRVFVEYNKPGGAVFPGRPTPDPFWLAIRDVILNDGRRARDVILPLGGHDTHFHWRINP